MTFDQLVAFVAVAERQHLTKAAESLNLSASAVSAAIKALENVHGVKLFHRVGRGIELTHVGQRFLGEARETLERARYTERILDELAGSSRGTVEVRASQTISNYWLPKRLMQFSVLNPGVAVNLRVSNTASVAASVLDGTAELGFLEGAIDEPALASSRIAFDHLVIVTSDDRNVPPNIDGIKATDLLSLSWVMREKGSGTRSAFENAVRLRGVDPDLLNVVLTLPSNEAILSAVRAGTSATALSESVVAPFLARGELKVLPYCLDPREFVVVKHKERPLSPLAALLERACRQIVPS